MAEAAGKQPIRTLTDGDASVGVLDSSNTRITPLTDTALRATAIPADITQIGSLAVTLGQKTAANSFPIVVSTDGPELKEATIPVVYNVTCVAANTEYSQALPTNCKRFTIQSRNKTHDFKISFTPGQSGTVYFSLPGGSSYFEELVNMTGKTLYFQSPSAGAVMEFVAWT